MELTRAERRGDMLHLFVADLHPEQPDEHEIQAHVSLLVERKVRELIPACADLGQTFAVHCLPDESDDDAHWLERIHSAHPAAACETTGCHVTSDCTCGECDCCAAAVQVLLDEHFARLNPGRLDELPAERALRLVRIGGVPGVVYCAECSSVEPAGKHAPPEPAPVPLKLAGMLRTG